MANSGISIASLPLGYQAQALRQLHTSVPAAAVEVKAAVPSLKPQIRRESQEQQLVIKWFNVVHRTLGIADERLLHAIPNGGWRREHEAKILIGEGVRPGYPDLGLDVACGDYHGLRIEMKSEKGVVSASQNVFHALLTAEGFKVAVCYGFEEVRREIEAYCNLGRTGFAT
jgi:hypothetical protein